MPINMEDFEIKNLIRIDLKDAKRSKEDLRPLIIDLEFSASGKIINKRIYPPAGHKKGLASWTTPYAKPVLIHHDSANDPIGRVVSVSYEDTEKEALAYLNGNIQGLNEIKRAFQTNDAKAIKKTLKKYDALNETWPGLGRLKGKIKVVDLDAVQKFIDQRYLTFSAGQGTDSWTCMSCGSDWHNGDVCDHRPGAVDEDGDPVYFLCGNMMGKEISVEHEPANDSSIVLNMEFSDSKNSNALISMSLSDTVSTIPITKSIFSFDNEGSKMNLKDLLGLEIKTVIDLLLDASKLLEFKDALAGDSAFEVSWLIRMHDALHSQYDYELKWREQEDQSLPVGVFKLHAMLHELADSKNFRDAISNGVLDKYSAEGSETGEFVIQTSDKFDEDKLIDKLITKLQSLPVKEVEINDEKEKEVEVKKEVLNEVQDELSGLDWDLIDSFATSLVPNELKLDADQLSKLDDMSFCFKGKVCLANQTYIDAARSVFDKTKMSDKVKLQVKDFIDNQERLINSSSALQTELDTLKQDYAQALLQIDALTNKFTDTCKQYVSKVDSTVDINSIKLDQLLEWFATIVVKPESKDGVLKHPVDGLKPLSDKETIKKLSVDSLTAFNKNFVNKYKKLMADGKLDDAARLYRDSQKALPKNFNPEDYE